MIDDVGRLEQRADELRAEGWLDAAARAYAELLAIAPGHLKAERLLSSLAGRESALPSAPGGLKPAPFVVVRQLLPPEVHDALLACFLSKADEFGAAATTEGLHRDYRRSMILPDCFGHVAPELKEAFYGQLLAHWPKARVRLRVSEFEPLLSETHALLYRDGDFFASHRDTGPNNTRRVTFLYNLHRTPRQFHGGDLLLYDTYFRPGDGKSGPEQPRFAETCTRLVPEDNRLVFFPSEFYHEVSPVSDVGEDLAGARFAINGWLHTSREGGDLDHIAFTPY